MIGHVIVNGKLLPRAEAHISLYHKGLVTDFGVYETIAVDGGALFHAEEHLERLLQSAGVIELPIPYTPAEMLGWLRRLIVADALTHALFRILVFGPNGKDDTLVCILPDELPRYPESFYTAGATAVSYTGTRSLPTAKTFNTLVNFLALRQAQRAGAHEALLVNAGGCWTEGSRSNLFAVAAGRLITPPAELVLSGITRDLVRRLAQEAGIGVHEEALPTEQLGRLSEMFVTSTSMHIIPIVRVDGQVVGDGRVGPITRELMRRFEVYYAAAVGKLAR